MFENPSLREKMRFTEKDAKKVKKKEYELLHLFTFYCNTLELKINDFTEKDAKNCTLPRRCIVPVFIGARHL